jgi:glycosyltransferase involved in cell wall biosynthesis
MTRVLHVVLSLDPGGAERLVMDLCDQRPEASAVVCLDDIGAWGYALEARGVPVEALGRRPGFRPGLARRIAEAATRHGASVLHCHEYSAYVYGLLAKRLEPSLRVVATIHGRLSDAKAGLKRQLANRMLRLWSADVYAVSHELRLRLIEEGFAARHVHVIHNGVRISPLPGPDARSVARDTLGLGPTAPVVMAVGRLAPVKHFAALIDAIGLVRAQHAAVQLVIIGDGPEHNALRTHVEAAGLTHRDDARQLMAAADVFVSSSVYEGISLTLLEAMAAGLPVVATRVGGTPEVVWPGETGLLVPARNAQALARGVQALLADRQLAASLGAEGRRRVEHAFKLDRMLAQYAAVYDEGNAAVH